MAVACITAGHHAVKQIHAAGNCLNDIAGGANAHQVADLILGHVGLHLTDHFIHHFGGLAHSQTADGVTVQIEVCDLLHVLHTQIRKGTALIDAKQQLIGIHGNALVLQAGHFNLTAFQPTGRSFAAGLGIIVLCGVLYAFIKGHGDGRTKVCLDLHALFRSHKDAVAVQMGGKGHALFGDLAQLCQTEYLKSTAVGQNGAVPAGKFVQTAHIGYQLVAGAQMQVVGVAQHDLCANVFQVLSRQPALDGTGGSHVLKSGRLHRAVHGLELAPPGVVFLLEQLIGRQRRHSFCSFLCTENSRAIFMKKPGIRLINNRIAGKIIKESASHRQKRRIYNVPPQPPYRLPWSFRSHTGPTPA